MSKPLSVGPLKRVLNVCHCETRLADQATPGSHHVIEFKGPDGLRYVATVFNEPGMVAVICLPAPMRKMPARAWEPALRQVVEIYEAERLAAEGGNGA